MTKESIVVLDCTLRDGGYYNDWDFSDELICDYLSAMGSVGVDYVELGFRSLINTEFRGACAYTTDQFISNFSIPDNIKIGVMVNASELLGYAGGIDSALDLLFDNADRSPVSLVRVACHIHEISDILPAARWLNDKGYLVGLNLMQAAGCSGEFLSSIAEKIAACPVDVLYFADSMGSLDTENTLRIAKALKQGWDGSLGMHAHDNMGRALNNTVAAIDSGLVKWVDSTVLGMGRGAGNVQTEYLLLALDDKNHSVNITSLLHLINDHFKDLKSIYNWGCNPYYYLAGMYSIHPSYVQEMLRDSRYSETDILAAIDHLKLGTGKKYSLGTLEASRHFYNGDPVGSWVAEKDISERDVLILGTGNGVVTHREGIEQYIRQYDPFVIALNTNQDINQDLINIRAACHPVRLLADCADHLTLPQDLVTPYSMLPEDVREELESKNILDFGISVTPGIFEFGDCYCTLPNSLVISYALAIATSGKANRIILAGFDGYEDGDPRNVEMDELFSLYHKHESSREFFFITPTVYRVPTRSVYCISNEN